MGSVEAIAASSSLDTIASRPHPSELNLPDQRILEAKRLIRLGNTQLQQGQAEAALENWRKAEMIYLRAGDQYGVLGSQMNQSQALQSLGYFRSASVLLSKIKAKLEKQPNDALKVQTFANLGTSLQATGDLPASMEILKKSLALADQVSTPPPIAPIRMSLGNSYRYIGDYDAALREYDQAIAATSNISEKLEIELNKLGLLMQLSRFQDADPIAERIYAQLSTLKHTRRTVFLQVNWAKHASKLYWAPDSDFLITPGEIATVLGRSVRIAQKIQDPRAESFATGQLGAMYERNKQWNEALSLTQKALSLAKNSESLDVLYRWQWQEGRIYKQKGRLPQFQASLSIQGAASNYNALAVESYSAAVDTLNQIRLNLLSSNQDTQLSYQDSVEPVYRELADLLLHDQSTPEELEQARDVIENLQLAELENFFRSACIDSEPARIDSVDSQAAVVYPIILKDRLEVVISIPGEGLSHQSIAISQDELESTLTQYNSSLHPRSSNKRRLNSAKKIHGWLISPFQAQLKQQKVQTLVFVMDGMLRNIPMASLHDGTNYLVEQYSLAIAPGLQQVKGQLLEEVRREILVAGLTESRQGFAALPAVKQEVTEINAQVSSRLILDQDFTAENLQEKFVQSNSPIIHLATHGQFSSKPEETFLLSWDKKITVQKFQEILSQVRVNGAPIELLVMSACQTASGDRHAALGLAGLAIRSGALSTIGTLWPVQDQATSIFMTRFYQRLSEDTGTSKAELLRAIQSEFIQSDQYQHPYYWAPFILVGSWQ